MLKGQMKLNLSSIVGTNKITTSTQLNNVNNNQSENENIIEEKNENIQSIEINQTNENEIKEIEQKNLNDINNNNNINNISNNEKSNEKENNQEQQETSQKESIPLTIQQPQQKKKRPPPLKLVPKLSMPNGNSPLKSPEQSDRKSGTGFLSQVEKKFQQTGKLHLVLDKVTTEIKEPEKQIDDNSYETLRKSKRIYVNSQIHKELIMLILNLIVSENGVLDPLYTNQFPDLKGMKDVLFILSCHLDHPSNAQVAKDLFCQDKLNPGILEILKLTSQQFFDMSKYQITKVIGEGAYGLCSEAVVKYGNYESNTKVVIKQIKISESPKARSVLHDIFNEILILKRHCRDERVSHMFEYGFNGGYYNIIMYQYQCSLGSWRRSLPEMKSPMRQMLFLNIFKEVLRVCQVLNQRIIHYDIKCENFFIEPLPGMSIESVMNPQTDVPPFKLCLGDFGEACVYRNDKEANATRHRGTESIKPPEMLRMDLKIDIPVNAACDIWAIGCLFYELYTSKMLFAIADVAEFYFRVLKSEELLIDENKELLDNNESLIKFVEFVLNRDPTKRPVLSTVVERFDDVLETFKKEHKKDIIKPKKTDKQVQIQNIAKEIEMQQQLSQERIQQIELTKPIEKYQHSPIPSVFKYYSGIYFASEMNDEEVYKRGIKYVMNFGTDLPTSLSLTQMTYTVPQTIGEMIKLFKRMIEVLREFIITSRRVFICGENGYWPGIFLVAFTMQKHYLSLYESYLYIQKICPYLKIQEDIMKGLSYFEKNPFASLVIGNDPLRHFHCYCGKVDIVLLTQINPTKIRNCRCESASKECCPNKHNGCKTFLNNMKEKYGWESMFMNWVGTQQKNIVNMEELMELVDVLPSKSKNVKIYCCKTCGFILFAIPKKGKERKYSLNNKHYDIFLVTNTAGIEVFHNQ